MGPRGQEPNESTDDAVWQDLVARLEGTASDPLATEASPRAQEPPAGAPGARPEGRGVHRTDAAGAAPAARGGGEPDGLTDREREIVLSRVPDLAPGLAEQLVKTVRALRAMELKKSPSISESIDWARTLLALGLDTLDEDRRAGDVVGPQMEDHRVGG